MKHGLLLHQPSKSDTRETLSWRFQRDCEPLKYYGMVIRVHGESDIGEIHEALRRGESVIALLPVEEDFIFCHGAESTAKQLDLARALGLENPLSLEWLFRDVRVWWLEVKTGTSGRLFVTCDGYISDGAFLRGYGWTLENETRIGELVKQFSIFKYPQYDIEIHTPGPEWPSHEPFSLVMNVINHGPPQEQTEFSVALPDSFRPLNPTDRVVTHFDSLQKISLAQLAVPEAAGEFELVEVRMQRSEPAVHITKSRMMIVASLSAGVLRMVKEDDTSLSCLMTMLSKAGCAQYAQGLQTLLQVDRHSCLNKIRVITETVLTEVMQRQGLDMETKSLADLIDYLRCKKLVSQKGQGYLHAIRMVGNVASHSGSTVLTERDVLAASYALSAVLEELLDNRLL